MKRQHILSAVLLTVVAITAAGQDPVTSCRVGKDSAAFGFWTWAPQTTVKVYVLTTDFKADEIPYLLAPVTSWNAVMRQTESGVKFVYSGSTSTPLYCQNCLTLMRGPVFEKTRRHATELRTYSAKGDQIMMWAHIIIDPVLTNPKALTNAVAHELGHNLGLWDCYSCKAKSTVMIQFKSINSSNDMEGPTSCDVAQVKAAYKELSVRVRPAPKSAETEDEGEEPVDDDTPVIVVKKP